MVYLKNYELKIISIVSANKNNYKFKDKNPIYIYFVYTHTFFLGLVEHKHEHYFFFFFLTLWFLEKMNQDKLEFDVFMGWVGLAFAKHVRRLYPLPAHLILHPNKFLKMSNLPFFI